MLILKAAALAIVVCVLVLCLKKDQPGFAFLLSLCGAAGLLWFAVQQLRPLLALPLLQSLLASFLSFLS